MSTLAVVVVAVRAAPGTIVLGETAGPLNQRKTKGKKDGGEEEGVEGKKPTQGSLSPLPLGSVI